MKYFFLFAAVLLSFNSVNGQGKGAVRLNYNRNVDPSNTQGVVEVYYNGRWGPICHFGSSDNNIPDVVCHQLGYTGGYSGSDNSVPLSTSPVFDDVYCSSNYLTILQCTYSSNPSLSCTSSYNMEVTCYTTRLWDSPYTGMIRLQGGYYSGQGRVEVYCNGQWGVVCNSGSFNSYAATTICTQLGYNDYVTYSSVSYSGTAWLNNVNCYSQSCLSQCSGGSCPSSSVSCSYAANVTCEYTTSSSTFGSTRYTCGIDGLTAGAIAGIILGVLFAVFVCIALVVAIPLCICCCCGIGIGAATSGTRTTRVAYSNF